MAYDPNDRWTTAVAGSIHAPVWVLKIAGYDKPYATAANIPAGGPWSDEAALEDAAVDGTFDTAWSAGVPIGWTWVPVTETLSEETSDVWDGRAAVKITAGATPGGTLNTNSLSLDPGKWYTIVVHWKGGTATTTGRVQLYNSTQNESLDTSLVWVGGSAHYVSEDPGTSYVANVTTFQVDAGFGAGDNYSVYLRSNDMVTGEELYFDSVEIYGPADNEYCLNILNPPTGGSGQIDIISGTYSIQDTAVTAIDDADELTGLIATDASGAALSTLINRRATIWGGYRTLDVSDYAAVTTGRITSLRTTREFEGYTFGLSDILNQLDGQVMTGATETEPTTIRGNVVNMYWSILTGTFDTGHATFPLDAVSSDSPGSSSAPTGLGIATTDINETQLTTERDTWRATDTAVLEFYEPVEALEYLQAELFRVFQCQPTVSGDGLIGLKFNMPSLPRSAATEVGTGEILEVNRWERLYRDHLNQFRVWGDYDAQNNEFLTLLYNTDDAADTTDRTNTGETIEWRAESKWLDSAYSGAALATEIASRLRLRYLATPAMVECTVTLKHAGIEQGDVIALTHPHVPDLFAGSRGLTNALMTVLMKRPDYSRGLIRLVLLDTRYRRFGVIAPSGTADFTSATALEVDSFLFISDSAGLMSDGTDGYRLI